MVLLSLYSSLFVLNNVSFMHFFRYYVLQGIIFRHIFASSKHKKQLKTIKL